MATFKSVDIAARDAITPGFKSNPTRNEAPVFIRWARVDQQTLVTSDFMRFFRVRSSDVPLYVSWNSEGWGANSVFEAGLYNINGGGVVDKGFFQDTVDASDAVTNVKAFQFNDFPLAPGEGTIWQQLGLSSDPGLDYDFVITATTVTDSLAGLAGFSVHYYYTRTGGQ